VNTNEPRHSCYEYFIRKGCKNPVLLKRAEFDQLVDDGFVDGPFRDTFGDGYGEPYNPHRQAFGMLKDGRGVYCELNKDRG